MRIDKVYLKEVGPFQETLINFPKGKRTDRADVFLLTGPNGSGKSTVLYAIAGAIGTAVVGDGKHEVLRLLTHRFRGREAIVAIASDNARRAICPLKVKEDKTIDDPFNKAPLILKKHSSDAVLYIDSIDSGNRPHFLHQYYNQVKLPRNSQPKFSWAAFAYAGVRSIGDVRVTSIQEPSWNPFLESLSFVSTANSERFTYWIVSQQFKRFKAMAAGRHQRAEQLASSIRKIEEAIAQIIEDQNFSFVTSDEDNDVRIRWKGRILDFGVLPDGLKSIVSWIADLLMRLDQIPWVDGIPTLERSFLLLLDEIDIHLHPSWQRKILPIIQRLFPNAQIIASTHSPFVVASAEDARIITLKVENGIASEEQNIESSLSGVSYSSVLRSIFGIDSEFDIETEQAFVRFHEAMHQLLSGVSSDRSEVERIGLELAQRSEEVKELVAIELRQLDRQLTRRGNP